MLFCLPLNNTLLYVQSCHEVELIILQGSKGSDVELEFHWWQGKHITVPPWANGLSSSSHCYMVTTGTVPLIHSYLCEARDFQ